MATDGGFEDDPGVEPEGAPPEAAPIREKRPLWPTALLLALAALLIFLFIKWVSPDSTAPDAAPAETSDSADPSGVAPAASPDAAPSASAPADLTAPGPITSSSVPPTADTSNGQDKGAQDSSALIGGYTPH
ncbi:hypothetical protein [Phenylobacterium aquaticum]|uniref:hypothetical protein n=1 Tax=Phenylobacterium aquaticum TaxID=1763816 RepID=UPI001F5CD6FF|nr:hypothetical protein [Phenylobacterium aquaticum]MCI3135471.1 hypothetical protein [Phenylobacterium aquaticum]